MLFRNGIINPTEVQTNIKMQNIFKDTVFIKGVLDINKMPIDDGFEFVLAGRSNAGKSSALNCLAKNKKLASKIQRAQKSAVAKTASKEEGGCVRVNVLGSPA